MCTFILGITLTDIFTCYAIINQSVLLISPVNKMPRSQENERIQAVLQLAANVNVGNVNRQFNCHRITQTILRQRYHHNGNVRDRPRYGRPNVTTLRQDRHLTLTHLRHRFKTATSTARELAMSKDMILNRLRAKKF